MKITVSRSGGVAGRRIQQSIDTTAVADGNTFESLVDGAALPTTGAPPPSPDRFQYVIDVDGQLSHLAETDLTETQRALIDRVLGG